MTLRMQAERGHGDLPQRPELTGRFPLRVQTAVKAQHNELAWLLPAKTDLVQKARLLKTQLSILSLGNIGSAHLTAETAGLSRQRTRQQRIGGMKAARIFPRALGNALALPRGKQGLDIAPAGVDLLGKHLVNTVKLPRCPKQCRGEMRRRSRLYQRLTEAGTEQRRSGKNCSHGLSRFAEGL